jgi:hypothetical protein
MKPMLAKKYNGRNITFPCYIQPKLNGIRALWLPDTGLLSRGRPGEPGILWKPSVLPQIHENLKSITIPLDGELYCHGLSLQEINKRVAVKRNTPHDDCGVIVYNVFDTPMPLPFFKRLEYINDIKNAGLDYVTGVETYYCSSSSFGDKCHSLNLSDGYEGSMYRTAIDPYGFEHACGNQENRWNYLLKRKDWLELDATIIGFEEEHDINGHPKDTLGSFVCRTDEGKEFCAGSGLTAYQRSHYWPLRHLLVGSRVNIKYEMLSDSGIPLKPSIVFVDDSVLYV